MTHQIQILYVDGCPNVDRAREVVRRSLLAAGLSESVKVVETVGDFASPTVLVDGRDVTGRELSADASCRLDAPTVDEVMAALMRDAE